MGFELGMVVQTIGVAAAVEEDFQVGVQVAVALARFAEGDWGDVPREDAKLNEDALAEGGRLLGSYPTDAGKVWVITEADRSVTTVLFPSEY